MDSNRLEIIKSLQVAFYDVPTYDELADFIIEDRRILEPLIEANKISDAIGNKESTAPAWQRLDKAVYATIKLAGYKSL